MKPLTSTSLKSKPGVSLRLLSAGMLCLGLLLSTAGFAGDHRGGDRWDKGPHASHGYGHSQRGHYKQKVHKPGHHPSYAYISRHNGHKYGHSKRHHHGYKAKKHYKNAYKKGYRDGYYDSAYNQRPYHRAYYSEPSISITYRDRPWTIIYHD